MATGGRGSATCVAHVRAVAVVGPNRRPEGAGASAEASMATVGPGVMSRLGCEP
jgi:hypothetical protein